MGEEIVVVGGGGGGGISGGWGPIIQGPGGEYGESGGGYGGDVSGSGGGRVVDPSDRANQLSRHVLAQLGFTGNVGGRPLPPATQRPDTPLDYLFGLYLGVTLSLLTVGIAGIASGSTLGVIAVRVESGGGAAIWAFQGARGTIQIAANISQRGTTLVLEQVHIQGAGAGTSSLAEMRLIFQLIGRSFRATKVLIRGGLRTSSARPGHVPRDITIPVP